MDLAYLIRRAARNYPSTAYFEDERTRRTLATLTERAERFANALDTLEVPAGAPVGVLSENRLDYIEVDLGLALARRTRVALNARLNLEDFAYSLADSKAVALVHSGSFSDEAVKLGEELGLITLDLDSQSGYQRLLDQSSAASIVRPGTDEDPAWITYTSGTTGRPKGIVLSQRSIRQVSQNILLELGPVRPGEQLVLTQALSHGAGYFVLPYLISGAGLCIQGTFDPERVARLSERPEITSLKIVPAMLPGLLDTGLRLDYETIVYGASPISKPVLDAALERLGPVLIQIYGQSEAPVTLTCLGKQEHVEEGDQRASAGRPWRSVALEVRNAEGEALGSGEVGEVTVSGDHLMSGYLGLPEATAEVLRDGWVWTKDMGYVDDRGYVYLVGRRDEMINSGGFNIAPREVERVLLDHPEIEECVVVGLPDARWGSAVNAVVRCRRPLNEEEVIAFARPRLGFRTPKRVHFVGSIPRNPYGKVDRVRVLEALAVQPT